MAVSDQTRSGDLAETFKSERETTKNQIRVALPGIVQSFAPDAVTAVVQPAIRYVEIDNDGNRITKKITHCWWMCQWYSRVAEAVR
ncbi:putative phage related protein [Escherichia coli]|uniref:Putative phage related protein n=1 Tax=Escherichia coli TaxID=562 RepID=A0A377AWT2_ECOLX|nr:putative phage related protein [Escherichia coli]